jgi:hypothetical protein
MNNVKRITITGFDHESTRQRLRESEFSAGNSHGAAVFRPNPPRDPIVNSQSRNEMSQDQLGGN